MPSDPKVPSVLDDEDHDDADATRVGSGLPPAAARSMAAYFIVLSGPSLGQMFRVEDGAEIIVGRASNVAISLHDENISRRHARVSSGPEGTFIEDLGSANGTFVDGVKVTRRSLADGDKVQLGATTILKFTYHDDLEERFHQNLYDAARCDGLTKIYNKRFFLERLEAEFAFANRHKANLSLLMLDVDHFKKVNDVYGHPAGDAVLVGVAQTIRPTLRKEDVFARYGGEEFAVICRGISEADAAVLGERMRSMIEAATFDSDGASLRVTASVGVGTSPSNDITSSLQLIAAADAALYSAKRAGRNRVVCFSRRGPE